MSHGALYVPGGHWQGPSVFKLFIDGEGDVAHKASIRNPVPREALSMVP